LSKYGPFPITSFEDVLEGDITLNTSAGFSFPGFKKSEIIEEAFFMSRKMFHNICRDIPVYHPPSKLAFRGHLSHITEKKVRPVWNFPFEILILESVMSKSFYKNL